MYDEAGRLIHRMVALILCITTWVTMRAITPEFYIYACVVTSILEFGAYKVLSNRTLRSKRAHFVAAVTITITSGLFSFASSFVLESSVRNRHAPVVQEQHQAYVAVSKEVDDANNATIAQFEKYKNRDLEEVNARYDRYQDWIGTAWWKRDHKINPAAYAKYSKTTDVGKWVSQRDSLETARGKELAVIRAKSLDPEGLIQKGSDYSRITLASANVMAVATRWSIILIDIFCSFLALTRIFDTDDEEHTGLTDLILILPKIASKALTRNAVPIVKEEALKDKQSEALSREMDAKIEALTERLEEEKDQRMEDQRMEDLPEKIVVGDRQFKNKKSLQSAISRAKANGNDAEVALLQKALNAYNALRDYPRFSSN